MARGRRPVRIQGCTWLSSLFCSSVKRGCCFCMLLRASRSSRRTVSVSLLPRNGPLKLPVLPKRPPQRVPEELNGLRVPPDRKLVRHHDLLVRVGHQQPDGVLQDALDEPLLALPARVAAAPCWLLAGVVVLRGVNAPEVLAGVAAALADAWVGGQEVGGGGVRALSGGLRAIGSAVKLDLLVPLVPEELQPLEPEPEPEDLVPEDPDPEAAEPVPERESSWSSRSSRSLEVDMASWLDSLVSA